MILIDEDAQVIFTQLLHFPSSTALHSFSDRTAVFCEKASGEVKIQLK